MEDSNKGKGGNRMRSPSLLDKAYNVIIKRMVRTGQAPHYTEIAAKLRIPVEDGRKALHDLVAAGIPGIWLSPEIISAVLHRSATFQPSTGSRSMASKSGLVSEVLSRWQFAGFSRARWCRLTRHALIAVRQCTSKYGTGLY